MSGAENDDQRWQALADLCALGVPLADDDAAFFAEYAATHPECAAENEAWDGLLRDLRSPTVDDGADEADDVDDETFVASLLATYRAGQPSTDAPEERPVRAVRAETATDEAPEPLEAPDPLGAPTPPATVHSLPSRRRWPVFAVAALATAAALAVVLLPGDDDPTTGEPRQALQARAPAPAPALAPSDKPVPSTRDIAPSAEPARTLDSALIALSSPGGITIDGRPAATGSRIAEGATLSAKTETCMVFEAPFASVCLGPGTIASLGSAHDGDRRFNLERGALVATLDKIPEGHAFTVMADGYTARAVGTVFSVRVADGEADLGVFEGIVELRSSEPASPARSLKELEHTGFNPSSEVRALPADLTTWSRDRSALAELWRGLDNPSQLHLGASSAALSVDGRTLGDTSHRLPAGLDLLVAAGEHTLDVHSRSGAKSHVVSASPQAPVVLTSSDLKPPPRAATSGKTRPITAAAAIPSIDELRTRASDARATRSWRDAKAAYEALLQRYPDAPEALNARVQLGDLLRRRLGQPAAALLHFDAYLAGGGPLAAEARFGKVLTLQQLGRRTEEAEAIEDFLRQHPKHIEAEKLRARARELAEP